MRLPQVFSLTAPSASTATKVATTNFALAKSRSRRLLPLCLRRRPVHHNPCFPGRRPHLQSNLNSLARGRARLLFERCAADQSWGLPLAWRANMRATRPAARRRLAQLPASAFEKQTFSCVVRMPCNLKRARPDANCQQDLPLQPAALRQHKGTQTRAARWTITLDVNASRCANERGNARARSAHVLATQRFCTRKPSG